MMVDVSQGAEIVHSANEVATVCKVIGRYLRCKIRGETPPYFMWFGASSRTGTIGLVEAGLELARQIEKGQLPMPRYLFVTTGSCGTQAGLLVGLMLAGIPTEVIGVRVVDKAVTNRFAVAYHANRTVRYLRKLAPEFPSIHISPSEIRLLDDYFGGQYGRPTPEGKSAIRRLWKTEGLHLDPTYTGKTFAGMLDFIQDRHLTDEPVLFWHTYNSVDISKFIEGVTKEEMPVDLQPYFDQSLYDSDL
jgi:D-cysteine desulfhydrase